MNQYAEIAVSCPLRQVFDYRIPEGINLEPGMRVMVPFGRRVVTGIIIHIKNQSQLHGEIKTIIKKMDEFPLFSQELLALGLWASQYYQHPLGEVLLGILPLRLRQGKEINIPDFLIEKTEKKQISLPHQLNNEQEIALQAIKLNLEKFHVFLLYGVTGSGKTEVYFHAIDEILKKKQQILFLIPEISLSPQTLARFEQRFSCPIFAIHSGLTDKKRLSAWAYANQGNASIIIGTRSAIFTPFKNLSLIIVDEEHDASYKQQDGFRYSARDMAIKRAQQLNIPIILGSATPSSESYYHALNKKYELLTLSQRAGNAHMPDFKFIHSSAKNTENGLSSETKEIIQRHLSREEQVLVFINRRGFSPVLLCQSCDWKASCSRCDTYLVLHKKDKQLICHHCGHKEPLPSHCPCCSSYSLLALGEGTQRIVETLETNFPSTKIIRIDRDNIKKKNELENQLNHMHEEKASLLVGTQMLAKGHHFPHITLVVILGIDHGLMSHDFHALESTAQLIMQVAGRAGRGEKSGLVLLQSAQAHHPQLQLLTEKAYSVFLSELLKERALFSLPPFSYLALFRVEAKKKEKAEAAIQEIHSLCKKNQETLSNKNITVYDPLPAPLQKKAGFYHFQLLIQGKNRGFLQAYLKKSIAFMATSPSIKSVRWSIELDPIHLL